MVPRPDWWPSASNRRKKRAIADIEDLLGAGIVFSTRHLSCKSGIMVTGSHNPADHNGLKIVLNQQTIAAGGIQDIRERIEKKSFSSGNGRIIRDDVMSAYMEEVLQDIQDSVEQNSEQMEALMQGFSSVLGDWLSANDRSADTR